MESIANRNMKSRIRTSYRDAQKRNARLSSKKSHGEKAMRLNLFVAMFGAMLGIFKSIGRSIRSLFTRDNYTRNWCSKKPYVYVGEPRAKGATGKRYGVYMREQGRKYKKARAA